MRGPDHEEAASPQADPGNDDDHDNDDNDDGVVAVRGVHQRGAHLHHHGADEEREPAGVPPGQGPHPQADPADRHGGPGGGRHGLPRVAELHPQGPRRQVRSSVSWCLLSIFPLFPFIVPFSLISFS